MLGDEDLLVNALRNLLENAVAYSPEKTRVVVGDHRDGDDAAQISVADQGIGIPRAGPGADLRAVLPGGPGPVPGHRRDRARAWRSSST